MPLTQRVLVKHGYPRVEHRAAQLKPKERNRFALFLAVDRFTQREAQLILGGPPPKVHLLREYVGLKGEIPDPYDGDEGDYEETFALVEEAIQALIAKLKQEAKKKEGGRRGDR